MIESTIEAWVCEKAEEAGWLVRKVKWIGRSSAADRLFAKNGRVLFIEFKRPDNVPTPTQERELQRLRDAGVEVHVVDNPLGALRVLGVPYA